MKGILGGASFGNCIAHCCDGGLVICHGSTCSARDNVGCTANGKFLPCPDCGSGKGSVTTTAT